jgi:hypothetical protein
MGAVLSKVAEAIAVRILSAIRNPWIESPGKLPDVVHFVGIGVRSEEHLAEIEGRALLEADHFGRGRGASLGPPALHRRGIAGAERVQGELDANLPAGGQAAHIEAPFAIAAGPTQHHLAVVGIGDQQLGTAQGQPTAAAHGREELSPGAQVDRNWNALARDQHGDAAGWR